MVQADLIQIIIQWISYLGFKKVIQVIIQIKILDLDKKLVFPMSLWINSIIPQKIKKMIKMVMNFKKLKVEADIIIWEIRGCLIPIQGMEALLIWQMEINNILQHNITIVR